MTTDRILTVKEVAAYLQIHTSTLYRLLNAGQFPGFRVGTEWRVATTELNAWRERQQAATAGVRGRT